LLQGQQKASVIEEKVDKVDKIVTKGLEDVRQSLQCQEEKIEGLTKEIHRLLKKIVGTKLNSFRIDH
jgi:DNA anti-recombination protein RmuC